MGDHQTERQANQMPASNNRTPAARKGAIYEMHTGAYEVEWPTAGKRTYDGVSVSMRREGSTLPSERLTVYADSTDAELQNAREVLRDAHNAVVLEIKRRADAPKDPRDTKIAEMEKLMLAAYEEIKGLREERDALKAKAASKPNAASTPASTVAHVPAAPTPNGAQPTEGERELDELPF